MSGTGSENGTYIVKNLNFDYTANAPHAGIFNANGILAIGSIANPNIAALAGSITSPGATISIGYSSPNITIDVAGVGGVSSVTGTANQVTASPTTGAVVVSTPVVFIAPGSIKSTTTVEVGNGDLTVDIGNVLLPTTTATTGQIKINSLRFLHNFGGTGNTFVGPNSGNFTLTNTENTGVGGNTLSSLTTGGGNVAVGMDSSSSVTTGSVNTTLGYRSMNGSNGAVDRCVAIGSYVLTNCQTSGQIAIGYEALNSGVSGDRNIAIGEGALKSTLTGYLNVAVGPGAGYSITSGAENVFIGRNCGLNNNGICNNIIGKEAGASAIGTASFNSIMGWECARFITNASNSVIIGASAAPALTSGNRNIILGYQTGSAYTTESNNILINSAGVVADANVMRLGTTGVGAGQVSTTYVAGVASVVVANKNIVTIDITTGQLGSEAAASAGILTLTGNSGGALSPTAGNINTLGTGSITIAGVGSTLTTQLTGLTANSVLYGLGTATIGLVASGTTGQVLQTNTGAAPTYSTATYPSTIATNQVLYSNAANTIVGLATTVRSVFVGNSSGVPVWRPINADGQILIGSGSSQPTAATITPGTGISIVNGANSITIASTSGGFAWSDTSGAFSPLAQNGYFITATATATLPAAPANGDTIKFFVDTTQILTIQATAGKIIRFGSTVSTAAGTAVSTLQGDSVELVYRTTNTCWCAVSGFSGVWNVT